MNIDNWEVTFEDKGGGLFRAWIEISVGGDVFRYAHDTFGESPDMKLPVFNKRMLERAICNCSETDYQLANRLLDRDV